MSMATGEHERDRCAGPLQGSKSQRRVRVPQYTVQINALYLFYKFILDGDAHDEFIL
jgi:hypothetical protein